MSALSETPGQFNFICIFATAVVSVLLLVREVNSVMNAVGHELASYIMSSLCRALIIIHSVPQ